MDVGDLSGISFPPEHLLSFQDVGEQARIQNAEGNLKTWNTYHKDREYTSMGFDSSGIASSTGRLEDMFATNRTLLTESTIQQGCKELEEMLSFDASDTTGGANDRSALCCSQRCSTLAVPEIPSLDCLALTVEESHVWGLDAVKSSSSSSGNLQERRSSYCLSIVEMFPAHVRPQGGDKVLMLVCGLDAFDFSRHYICVRVGEAIVEPDCIRNNVIRFRSPRLSCETVQVSLIDTVDENLQPVSSPVTLQAINPQMCSMRLTRRSHIPDKACRERLIRRLLHRGSSTDVTSSLAVGSGA